MKADDFKIYNAREILDIYKELFKPSKKFGEDEPEEIQWDIALSNSNFHEYKFGSKWTEDTQLAFKVDNKGNIEARILLHSKDPEAEKAAKEFSKRIIRYLAEH